MVSLKSDAKKSISKINVLCLGDIYGQEGQEFVEYFIKSNREKYDLIIVNGENSSHGFGITPKIAKSLFEAGADIITTGNHIWNKRDIYDYISEETRLLRPANYPEECPGFGYVLIEVKGEKVLVTNLQGSVFMNNVHLSPFKKIDEIISIHSGVKTIIVDMHAEATSEKMALGKYLDGKVSLFYGTHTHVQTNDAQILENGTGYCTDIGMCGSHSGVIGVNKETIINRFITGMPSRFTPSEGDVFIHGIEATLEAGKCTNINLLKLRRDDS